MISASGSINLLEQLPELRETLMFSLLQDMIKDTDEEPDEGCMGCGLGALSAGASVLMELGCATALNVEAKCTNLKA